MTVYDRIGRSYGLARRADPRVAAHVRAALDGCDTVVNVGAGAGSYEPTGRLVVSLEPSAVMLAQRPAGAAPAVQARAEELPFADGAFDAALAVLTTHHWSDPAAGLRELQRVSRRQVVLTWDPALVAERFWLVRDLLPEIVVHEAGLATLGAVLAGLPDARVEPVPVPHDCTDGFLAAHWRRPQAYLDPVVRAGMSSFALLDPSVVTAALERLAVVVQDGTWEREHADLLAVDELDVGYRLVIAGD